MAEHAGPRIDRDGRQVVLGTGEMLPYDRLILAAGSSSVPPIEGFGATGTVRAALGRGRDAPSARTRSATRAQRAVVAGGGLLGLEAAYALKARARTTVLERADRLLRRQLDQRAAELLRATSRASGWRSARGRDVGRRRDGRVTRQARRRPLRSPADSSSSPPGSPRTWSSPARPAGVNRGVVVDDRMRTSDPRSSPPATSPSSAASAGPVADRGRPGRGRGGERASAATRRYTGSCP